MYECKSCDLVVKPTPQIYFLIICQSKKPQETGWKDSDNQASVRQDLSDMTNLETNSRQSSHSQCCSLARANRSIFRKCVSQGLTQPFLNCINLQSNELSERCNKYSKLITS